MQITPRKLQILLGLCLLILSSRGIAIEVGETVILKGIGLRTVSKVNADGSLDLRPKTGEVEPNIPEDNVIATTQELEGLTRASFVIWKKKGVVRVWAMGIDGTLVVEPDFGLGVEQIIPTSEYVRIVKILPKNETRPEMKTFHKILTDRGEYIGASTLGEDGTVVYRPVWNEPERVISPEQYTPTIAYHPSGVRAFGEVNSTQFGVIKIVGALPDGSAIYQRIYTEPVIIIKPDEMTPIIPPPDEKIPNGCIKPFAKAAN